MQGVLIWSLVRELRSHMLLCQKKGKEKKRNQNINQNQYCDKFNKNFKNGPQEKKKSLIKIKSTFSINREKDGSTSNVVILGLQ